METMIGLSAAAQAVWRAHEQVLGDECVLTKTDMEALAAALRAAALVPDIDRLRLLAIADELEGHG
jgi:hypothetical protein